VLIFNFWGRGFDFASFITGDGWEIMRGKCMFKRYGEIIVGCSLGYCTNQKE